MRIACVTVVKNEEQQIVKALGSVTRWVDEIIVVDMQSRDRTVQLARRFTEKIYSHPDVGYVEPARNFSISKATAEWILVLDADEELPPSLGSRLRSLINQQADYYRLPRKNIIFNKWIKYSRWWPDYNIRFFKKGCVSWNERIHAVPETYGQGVDLPASEENAIVHHHYTSVEQFITRMNRYTSVEAEMLIKEGYTFAWKDLVKKPIEEFLSRYFFAQGYKDGVHGLALAGLQAFSELVLYLKVWQKGGFRQQQLPLAKVVGILRKLEQEVHYWEADVLVKEGKGGLIERIRRKFKL